MRWNRTCLSAWNRAPARSRVQPMGARACQVRDGKRPRFREARLDADEKAFLRANARYEGSPDHKRNPGDFGLTPPANPRKDRTLCDEAEVYVLAQATALFARAIDGGLVSEGTGRHEFPRRMWLVAEHHVFELKLGGSVAGRYHGFPVRRSNPYYDLIVQAWNGQ